MTGKKKRSLIGIILSRIVGFCIFLLLLGVAWYIDTYIWSPPLFHTIVVFLTAYYTLGALIFLSILFLIAELFNELDFPLNLPAPLFNGIASIFLIAFLRIIFQLIDTYFRFGLSGYLDIIAFILVPLVFILVVIVGYVKIFAGLGAEPVRPAEKAAPAPEPSATPSPQGKSWEEIGSEFRGAIYDLLHRIREELKK
jgi:hypothetical protein